MATRVTLPTPAPPGARAGHAPRHRLADMTTDIDGQVVDPNEGAPGSWLPIATAAHALGVSERTIRRRIERGQLKRRAHQDGHVEVWVPEAAPDGVSAEMADSDGQERALV